MLCFTEQLQSERMLSEDERSRLLNEIKVREIQVDEMRQQVDAKTIETQKLQDQVEEVQLRQQNNKSFHNSLNEIEDMSDVHVGKRIFFFLEKKRLKKFVNSINIKFSFLFFFLDLVKDNETEVMNYPQTELDRVVATDNIGLKEKLDVKFNNLNL